MCDGPMNHFHIQLIPRYSFELRGSTNFVKERKTYVYDKEKVNKSLREENKRLREANDFYREYPRKIIVQFWMWYASGNHKRDLSRKEEGEKYAENFLNDLVKEIGGIE